MLYEPISPSWEGNISLPDGRDRFVKRYGEGPEALVCLHDGPGGDHRLCEPLAAIADDEVQVVLYDQLGGGRSERPGPEHRWSIEQFVDELEWLVGALGLPRVHLLGQWWGGIVALELALRRPDLVKSLTLCNSIASAHTLAAGCEAMIAAAPEQLGEALREGRPFDPEDDSAVGQELQSLYASRIRRSHPFDLERSRREFVEQLVPLLSDFGPAYEALWGTNDFIATGPIRDWDVSDRLAEIAAPTLVVSGAHDVVWLDCGREIVEGVGEAEWLILGQSSHFPLFEGDAGALRSAIHGFVSAPV